MLPRLVTFLTWIFAPIAGMAAVSLAFTIHFILGSTGYYELVPLSFLLAAVVVLWLSLAWAVGRLQPPGRMSRIHKIACVLLATVGGIGPPLLSLGQHHDPEQTTVTRIAPP